MADTASPRNRISRSQVAFWFLHRVGPTRLWFPEQILQKRQIAGLGPLLCWQWNKDAQLPPPSRLSETWSRE
jgi:hypothetical protein